ncbi:MAG: hypothetical protein ACO3M8_05420 [Ilumatobacteraceae bacterium]
MDVDDPRFDDEHTETLPDDVLHALRSVEVDQLARERAITAALAAAPQQRRINPTPLLGAAAAVLLVVAGAAIVLPRTGGDDAEIAIESAADTAASDEMQVEAAEAPEAELMVEERVASDEFSADEPAAIEAAPAMDDTGEADTQATVDDGAETPAELFDKATEALAAIQSGELKPPATDCVMMGGGPVVITVFRGVEVVLFADLANGSVTALATSDCGFVVDYQPAP